MASLRPYSCGGSDTAPSTSGTMGITAISRNCGLARRASPKCRPTSSDHRYWSSR